jgi:hypothetical protein
MQYLVRFSRDWADEFNCDGFSVYTQKQKDEWNAFVQKNGKERYSFYFGTNQGWNDVEIQDFAKSFTFTEITDDFAVELQTAFNFDPTFSYSSNFGVFFDIIEWAGEQDEIEDEDD